MAVYYIHDDLNRSPRYISKKGNKKFSYSINRFGDYAKYLAELSDKTNIKYNNIIIEKKKYNIIKIFSPKFGECDIKFDKENTNFISNYKWFLMGTDKPYCVTKINGKLMFLHKMLLEGEIIDHINRKTLDCRLSNLRVSSYIENNRNRTKPSTNNSGIMGVHRNRNNWVATWVNKDGKKSSKSFSIDKYGEDEALSRAIETRHKNTNHYTKNHIIHFKYKI